MFLTLKVLITFAADDTLKLFFFLEKIRYSHQMPCLIFSKNRKFRMLSCYNFAKCFKDKVCHKNMSAH